MSERSAFLKILGENEDDTTTRLVYADWLDEHGEHEEADRQRKWPAAKEWLVGFCRDYNPVPDDEDPDERVISYKELLELGREAIAREEKDQFGFSCGSNLTMCNALRDNKILFWNNWSAVTGIAVPSDIEGHGYFSCAC